MMLKALDTLIAHKMISLSDTLLGNDKRVAAALIDHFNRKTGQCDPSLNTIAELLGVHPRTVIRSIRRLVRTGFFRKVKHGGKFHRNSYEPMWLVYRQLDDVWKDRRKARRATFASPNVSLCHGQPRHPADDRDVTQTCLKNHFEETLQTVALKTQSALRGSKSESGSPGFGGWGLAEASLRRLRARIGEAVCESWFRDVAVVEVRGDTLVLSAPTAFRRDHITNQFVPQLLDCFRPDHPNLWRIEMNARPKDAAEKISDAPSGGGRAGQKSAGMGCGPVG
ncbi:helix-turn-helix domain-containing protein [Bradyrhizobium sp.]